MKYIVVTGGVLSGLGKGVTTASLGRILKDHGYSVVPIKIDGYVNVDPGTMNPYEHGEVFVLDDGSETDLDLGHYERFLNMDLTGASNITTGAVYQSVIAKERKGEYLGKTVQVIPHVTDEMKRRIRELSADVVLIEIGGTIGDIENRVFIEALRQMSRDPDNDVLFIHLSYVPQILTGEQKTKPTQHSVKELLSLGIQPDIVVGRADQPLEESTKKKIGLFCGVKPDHVLSNHTVEDIYQVSLMFTEQNVANLVIRELGLERKPPYTSKWKQLVERMARPSDDEVSICIIGKYTGLEDAYMSIKESFKHAGAHCNCRVNVTWVESDDIGQHDLEQFDGLLVPGGFGGRGVEGKIAAVKYARENGVPFLGICYGLQMAVIEYARHLCGLAKANTTEADPDTPHPVIDLIPEQKSIDEMGATMRLGAYPCAIKKGTLAHRLYKAEEISERHRHRWEVNPDYIGALEEKGLVFSGSYPKRNLMEICELPGHPYFIACQFHPEFKSRLENPSPLFYGLVRAALDRVSRGD